jgi:transcription elongation GreA/GreB family factor
LEIVMTATASPTANPLAAIPLTEWSRQRLLQELDALRAERAVRLTFQAKQKGEDEVASDVPAAGVVLVERRIGQIEASLARSIVVADGALDGETVLLGSSVVVRWDDGAEERYEIVTPGEIERGAGRVSCDAPLGRALIGRRAGDRVSVAAPAGVVHLTLQRVDQASASPR